MARTVSGNDIELLKAVSGDRFPVESLDLAAILCSLGFPQHQNGQSPPLTIGRNPEAPEKCTWWIVPMSPKYSLKDIMRGWVYFDEFRSAQPEHPLTYLRGYADLHAEAVRQIRSAVRISYPESERRKRVPDFLSTTNTKLATAIRWAGHLLDWQLPVTMTDHNGVEQATWWFPAGPAVRPAIETIIRNWLYFAEFELKDPEHPLCWQRTYGENREYLIRQKRDMEPLIMIPRNGRWALINPNCRERIRREVQKAL